MEGRSRRRGEQAGGEEGQSLRPEEARRAVHRAEEVGLGLGGAEVGGDGGRAEGAGTGGRVEAKLLAGQGVESETRGDLGDAHGSAANDEAGDDGDRCQKHHARRDADGLSEVGEGSGLGSAPLDSGTQHSQNGDKPCQREEDHHRREGRPRHDGGAQREEKDRGDQMSGDHKSGRLRGPGQEQGHGPRGEQHTGHPASEAHCRLLERRAAQRRATDEAGCWSRCSSRRSARDMRASARKKR